MKLGIVGLPNVGKSTLFNAITQVGAESANYPFCTIDPNIGTVNVPDPRIDKLSEMYQSKKKIYATIEFIDIAGLVKGASKGEGLGNKFLANIREVDAIVEVLRCFEDPNVVHVDGGVDPLRDIETIHIELILSDMEMLEKRLEKTRKVARSDKKMVPELELLEKVYHCIESGQSARSLSYTDEEKTMLRQFNLLSDKPLIYVANVPEADLTNDGADNLHVRALREYAKQENSEVVVISAQIEQELSELPKEDQALMLEELGIHESGLDKLVQSSYHLLGLMSFLTAGPEESRAWTIKKGTKAVDAAAKIHTDISRGFIRSETISFDQLVECQTMNAAKEKGLVRLEGKDYIMQDGDVVHFRFNV